MEGSVQTLADVGRLVGGVPGLVLELVASLVVAVVTAHLTVRLSIRQFRSTRWWEKKVEAYSQIMESLVDLEYSLHLLFRDAIQEIELKNDARGKAWETYGRGKAAVKRAAAAGEYVISRDAATALADLVRQLETKDPRGNWADEIDSHLASVHNCITRIRECAKEDLRTQRSGL